jgi:hypothetical protein
MCAVSPGEDICDAPFNVSPDVRPAFVAALEASAEFAWEAHDLVARVDNACRLVAETLGVPPTEAPADVKHMESICGFALSALRSSGIRLKRIGPPQCSDTPRPACLTDRNGRPIPRSVCTGVIVSVFTSAGFPQLSPSVAASLEVHLSDLLIASDEKDDLMTVFADNTANGVAPGADPSCVGTMFRLMSSGSGDYGPAVTNAGVLVTTLSD